MPPGVGFLLAGSAEPHSCKPEPPAEGMRFVVKNPVFPQFPLEFYNVFFCWWPRNRSIRPLPLAPSETGVGRRRKRVLGLLIAASCGSGLSPQPASTPRAST